MVINDNFILINYRDLKWKYECLYILRSFLFKDECIIDDNVRFRGNINEVFK